MLTVDYSALCQAIFEASSSSRPPFTTVEDLLDKLEKHHFPPDLIEKQHLDGCMCDTCKTLAILPAMLQMAEREYDILKREATCVNLRCRCNQANKLFLLELDIQEMKHTRRKCLKTILDDKKEFLSHYKELRAQLQIFVDNFQERNQESRQKRDC